MTGPGTERIPPEPWLETIEGRSPVLLIAPHGGRAGPAAHATLHPKVNDLHTAEITRELAERLQASALINASMDRNLIDCNRIAQLVERAPWMLEVIADRLERMVERFGRATVLIIHGWNIIEPRIDFGLGARKLGDELRPVGSARVSASDSFIHGPLAMLATRLGDGGIAATFGMRYPAGGINNLVQAFTDRHRGSRIPPLERISLLASSEPVNTAQLELSVSVRLPGEMRRHCIDAIADTFAEPVKSEAIAPGFAIVRAPRAARRAAPAGVPHRVGVEFYDASSRIGGMASFDLGVQGFGARIMLIVGERRVVLCTCEGTPRREADRLSLGPLSLSLTGGTLALDFAGPAAVVPDGSNYLSIERALATSNLDPAAQVTLGIPIADGFDPSTLFGNSRFDSEPRAASPLFAIGSGEARIEGVRYSLRASARAGASFTGLGPQRFAERRMIWALFESDARTEAIELRRVNHDAAPPHHNARILSAAGWSPLTLRSLEIETQAADAVPHRLEASAAGPDGDSLHLAGAPLAFVPLSRPGPDGCRIHTTLGFGTFRSGDRVAAGMFEYSRRIQPVLESEDSLEADSD